MFWMANDRTFIFHMCILCNMTFPYILNGKWYSFHISYAPSLWPDLFIGTLNFNIVTLILSFDDDGRLWNLPHNGTLVFHNTSCSFCRIHSTCNYQSIKLTIITDGILGNTIKPGTSIFWNNYLNRLISHIMTYKIQRFLNWYLIHLFV
jgi:hypothetical protein